MNNIKLGRLEKLNLRTDLRTYWKDEAANFTPWLAENIQLLSEEIGIELEVQKLEVSVGPFRADILCKDTNGNNVLIENQLEETDHDHLGQLMTYAAGLRAVTIIWIAKKFTDQHKAALNWLNENIKETYTFFGIEIELYKIEDSNAAPKFKIIAGPNGWTKQVKESASLQLATDRELFQQKYWQRLKDFMKNNNSVVTMQNAPLKYSTKIAIGHSNIHLTASVNSSDNLISISLNFRGDQANENYDTLYKISFKDSLTEISPDLKWNKKEGNIAISVMLKTSADYLDESDWNRQFVWFKEYLEKFTEYFTEKIKKLKKLEGTNNN